MRICIVGGGKVGYYLAETLLSHKHEPVVIEVDRAQSERIANTLDIPVINGSGVSVDALRAARCEDCRAMACVSGRDEVNLVAAQLGKKLFHVEKTVARVNNPRNTQVLQSLGVDIVVSATFNIANLIEREVETASVHHLLSLTAGAASLVEVSLPEDFRYAGQPVSQGRLPEDLVLVSILRGTELLIPSGKTLLLPGDRVTLIATDEALHKLVNSWKLSKEK